MHLQKVSLQALSQTSIRKKKGQFLEVVATCLEEVPWHQVRDRPKEKHNKMCSVLHYIFSIFPLIWEFRCQHWLFCFTARSLMSQAQQRVFPQVRSSPGRNCLHIRDTSGTTTIHFGRGINVVGWSHISHSQIPALLMAVPSKDLGWTPV